MLPSINDLKPIAPKGQYTDNELDSLDGFRVKIAKAEVVSKEVTYAEEFGKQLPEGETRTVMQVEVTTEPFMIPATGRQVTHTESFPLKKTDAGEWGVSMHEKSKSKRLFNKLGVQSFPEVIGKEIVIVKKVSDRGTKYLTFSI